MDGFDERRGDIQEKMEVLTLLGRRAKHEKRHNVVILFENGTELVDEIEECDHEDDVLPPYTASPTNYISRGINNNNENSIADSNAESTSAATIKPKKLPPPRSPIKLAIKYRDVKSPVWSGPVLEPQSL
ncbi:2453_t:CDS:2 [Ambispora gerdemannii]|uniref:2453_t:CDS:1 n=1 Tax=Ambispora gerdemannii TaxID=144530 RepID=A0A9N9CH49_9GLOM|nr:2453_t:CDS:2 [Ambispora gerdemannii]